MAERNDLGPLAWSRKMQDRLAAKVRDLERDLAAAEGGPEMLQQRARELEDELRPQNIFQFLLSPLYQTPEMENQRAELTQLTSPTYGNEGVPGIVRAALAVDELNAKLKKAQTEIREYKSLEQMLLLDEIRSLSQAAQHPQQAVSEESQSNTLDELRHATQSWLARLPELSVTMTINIHWLFDLRQQLSPLALPVEIQLVDQLLLDAIQKTLKDLNYRLMNLVE